MFLPDGIRVDDPVRIVIFHTAVVLRSLANESAATTIAGMGAEKYYTFFFFRFFYHEVFDVWLLAVGCWESSIFAIISSIA